MITLQKEDVLLRALEPTDLDFLYKLENEETVWEVSNTTTPYSKYILKEYISNAHRDIYDVKQLRLVITIASQNKTIGFVDLFDFEPKHHRVGVGIIILKDEERGKGYAYQALMLVCKYAFINLQVHQVYANIAEDNSKSVELFKKVGFQKIGLKKDWIFSQGVYKNELSYQLLNNVY
jgi:diamine N-acetyltransferase